MQTRLDVNGEEYIAEGPPQRSLLGVLRDELGMSAAKGACEQGECGSCSVLLDDELVCACLVPVFQAEGRTVVTLEGLADDATTSRVQDALLAEGGVQCGFCTTGIVLAARQLLERQSIVDGPAIREQLSGNLCRCTGYSSIVRAVQAASDAARDRS